MSYFENYSFDIGNRGEYNDGSLVTPSLCPAQGGAKEFLQKYLQAEQDKEKGRLLNLVSFYIKSKCLRGRRTNLQALPSPQQSFIEAPHFRNGPGAFLISIGGISKGSGFITPPYWVRKRTRKRLTNIFPTDVVCITKISERLLQ